MSIFDADIINRPLLIKYSHNIYTECFDPSLFYTWIWKERGIDYPSQYPLLSGVSKQLLREIFIDKLGNILIDDFVKWKSFLVKNNSPRYFLRYFKTLVKSKYIHNCIIRSFENDIQVRIYYGHNNGHNNGYNNDCCVIHFSEK